MPNARHSSVNGFVRASAASTSRWRTRSNEAIFHGMTAENTATYSKRVSYVLSPLCQPCPVPVPGACAPLPSISANHFRCAAALEPSCRVRHLKTGSAPAPGAADDALVVGKVTVSDAQSRAFWWKQAAVFGARRAERQPGRLCSQSQWSADFPVGFARHPRQKPIRNRRSYQTRRFSEETPYRTTSTR